MSDCCNANPSEESAPECCPQCGSKGRAISRITVAALAALHVPAEALAMSDFRLCPEAACETVYFASAEMVLRRDDLRVSVSFKDTGLDVPLCYCFSHTRRSIAAEVATAGHSSASATITEAVKAGRCACDIKNPSGTCCLGDVRKGEKATLAEAAANQEGQHDG